MASILRNKNIPMSFVLVELLFLLLRIIPIEEYDENGKKTGRIIGHAYDCVDTMNFDHFRIKIKGQAVPLMSNEDLQKLRNKDRKSQLNLRILLSSCIGAIKQKLMKIVFLQKMSLWLKQKFKHSKERQGATAPIW